MRALAALILGLGLAGPAAAARKRTPPPPPPRPATPDTPPEGARRAACPLERLPEAQVAWTDFGYFWLLESDDVLLKADLEKTLTWPGTGIRCEGEIVHVTVVEGGTALSVLNLDLVVRDIVDREAPWRTPEAKARRVATEALDVGDIEAARAALKPLDRGDPETGELWLWVAQELLDGGDAQGASDALIGVPMSVMGVPGAHAAAARRSASQARAALAAGDFGGGLKALGPAQTAMALDLPETIWPAVERRALDVVAARLLLGVGDAAGAAARMEPVVAADPELGDAWLALADARWTLRARKDARLAYAEATSRLPSGTLGSEVWERCPKCPAPLTGSRP